MARLTTSEQGELTGFDVGVDGRRLKLGGKLGTHPDRSVTYQCYDRQGRLVVRVFYRPPHADGRSLLLREPDLKGVWSYLSAGDAQLYPPKSRRESKFRRAWVTVRRFVPLTLKDALAAPRASTVDSFRLAIEVAEGLRSLHRHQIVHGDLRPSNVLSSKDGFQVADYGLGFDRRIRVGEAKYLAPEFLMHGHGNTASADVYSFGKLIREAMRGRSPVAEYQRDLILEVVERCLVIEPSSRPSIDEVLEILNSSKTDLWTEEALRGLNYAVLADLDARAPLDLGSQHTEWLLPRLVSTSCRRVAQDLTRRNSFRVSQLTDLEMVHFLGTAAFLDPRSEVLTRQVPSSGRILKAVDVTFDLATPRPDSAALGDVPSIAVDPQWREEIVSLSRADLEGRDLADTEIDERVANQVTAAEELTQSALASDAFIHSEQVALIMGSRCPGITADEVRILRDMGYLVSLPVGHRNLYPLFQFEDRTGMPRPVIKEVSDLLDFNRSTWGNSVWWFLAHPALSHATPATWLRSGKDPAAVLALFARVVA